MSKSNGVDQRVEALMQNWQNLFANYVSRISEDSTLFLKREVKSLATKFHWTGYEWNELANNFIGLSLRRRFNGLSHDQAWELMRYCIQEGASMDQVVAKHGDSLLIEAARIEDVEKVKWAIEQGADVNYQTPQEGLCALHYCAFLEIDNKQNPKMDAILEILDLLLKAGADPHLKDVLGRTALEMCLDEEDEDSPRNIISGGGVILQQALTAVLEQHLLEQQVQGSVTPSDKRGALSAVGMKKVL